MFIVGSLLASAIGVGINAIGGAIRTGKAVKNEAEKKADQYVAQTTEAAREAAEQAARTVRLTVLVIGGVIALVLLLPFIVGSLPTFLFWRGGPKTINAVFGGVTKLVATLIEGIFGPILTIIRGFLTVLFRGQGLLS